MRREMYDWPSRDDERRRGFGRIIQGVEYRVISPRRQRRPSGTDVHTMLGVIVGAVILGAVALRGHWNGRLF
jgi:hypothetical protein